MKRPMALLLLLLLVLGLPGIVFPASEREGQESANRRSKQEPPRARGVDVAGSKDPTSSTQPARDPRPRLNRCTVRVQPPDASATSRRREVSFSSREVTDLRFDLWLLESRSSEPAEVRVYAPGNRLYKVLRVGPSPSAVTAQTIRGLSRRGLSVLSAPMPLVGTHVTSRSLYGEWHVEGWFVDADEPCSRSVDFFLEP